MPKNIRSNPWRFDAVGQAEGLANKDSWTLFSDFTTTFAANTLTITGHGLHTGAGPFRMTNSGGALPTGFAAGTNYWVIRVDADTLKVAASHADALAGTAVSISDDGTGTHSLNQKPVFPQKLRIKYIVIDAGATGGAFDIREESGGKSLTGALTLAANAHELIELRDWVRGVYAEALADGQVLIYTG